MVYDALFDQMREIVNTLHSIDRNLDIIAKDIEKKNQKWSSTNDIMKKYFWKFFKPKNKEYTPYWESIADKIYDEAHKLKY